ncbi:MAG: hypothetical protein JWP97_4454 [Labilithrix sp.]|nr:hypothetical protein [Labilithrix sp.]
MRRSLLVLLGGLTMVTAACVPADEALVLGSAQFTVTGRASPRDFATADAWSVHVERFVLAFRTMTIVNLEDSEQCSYRGRGAASNVVFDGVTGSVVQAFNGIKPGRCPDVGLRLRPPDDYTQVGEGASPDDLAALLAGTPAHAILFASADELPRPFDEPGRELLHKRIVLRFDSGRTSSAFGGCRDAIRGARIDPGARDATFVAFSTAAFFRDALSSSASLRFEPFAAADADEDGLVTMDELDAYPLSAAPGPFYELASGSRSGSFGDYVRAQFQLSVTFGNGGLCNGLDPGARVDE